MASTFDKKFKTTETTKAGGAEVVSDPIELSPRTKNHVLTVTTDSSLSGTVDVEMEMSPDGTNWCPAVSRTVSGTGASQTGDVIGNQESVKLTPDAGEFKNKHARGGLNFDVNGAVVTPDGSGARDMMHQHIDVSKSFNYSQWFKTSEAPTTTYKPVLFRHGGYDDFENLKVVQTDSNTTTQNLSVVNFVNGNYLRTSAPTSYTNSVLDTSGGTVHSPMYSASNQSNTADIFSTSAGSLSIGFWFRNNLVATSSTKYKSIVQFTLSNGWNVELALRGDSSGNRAIGFFVRDGNSSKYFKYLNLNAVKDGNWHYMLWQIDSSGTYGGGSLGTNFFIDGTRYTQGSAFGNISNLNATNMANVTITKLAINTGSFTSVSLIQDQFDIDSLVFIKGFCAQADYDAIYKPSNNVDNTNNPYNATLGSGKSVISFFRFGDGPNDSISTPSSATIEGSNYIELTSGSDTPTFNTYLPGVATELPRDVTAEEFSSIFDTTANSSISGWFKTSDTGTLFSNTAGAVIDGLKMEVNASNMVLTLIDSSQTITASTDVDDNEWHHLVVTKPSGTTPTIKIYIDGSESVSTTVTTISNDDLRGTNGFTLLGDGQNNANAASPASTDASKLQASLSNWSLHTEVLSATAVKQLYSNGHVRNIKNLPDVTSANISNWWKFSSTTSPEEDSVGTKDLTYQDGASAALTTKVIDATGVALIEDSINGNAMTLSLTKSFNFTTNKWVSTADQDTALCLSFNGFEEQAEYFAIWKCAQTIGGSTIDICDGGWHNVILSYRGKNDLAGDNVSPGDTVKFGPGPANSLAFNWAMSYDGEALTAINDGSGVDYIGGLNTIATDTYNSVSYNVGFNIYNRHLKYEVSNTEEEYKPHAQFSSGIHEVIGVDNNNAFQGYVDETSFHSDTWWVNQAGTAIITNTFNQEKPATIYGSTTALTNRGTSTEYPTGVPYPLLNPEKLTTSGQASDIQGTNQYINPNRYDASTNPNGGLEGWWRWGDTPGDCSITINDVKDHNDSINARDIDAFGIVTADRQLMTSADSIFNADAAASTGGGTTITFPQVKIEGIQQGICNLSNINSPLLQYVRVKIKGAGSMDLGEGKGQARLYYTNRRRRRKK